MLTALKLSIMKMATTDLQQKGVVPRIVVDNAHMKFTYMHSTYILTEQFFKDHQNHPRLQYFPNLERLPGWMVLASAVAGLVRDSDSDTWQAPRAGMKIRLVDSPAAGSGMGRLGIAGGTTVAWGQHFGAWDSGTTDLKKKQYCYRNVHVVSRGAVHSVASSYTAVRTVAGLRPILVIA